MAETYTTQTEERLAALEAAARPRAADEWAASAPAAIWGALVGWAVTAWLIYDVASRGSRNSEAEWGHLVGLLAAGALEFFAVVFGAVVVGQTARRGTHGAVWGILGVALGGMWVFAGALAGGVLLMAGTAAL